MTADSRVAPIVVVRYAYSALFGGGIDVDEVKSVFLGLEGFVLQYGIDAFLTVAYEDWHFFGGIPLGDEDNVNRTPLVAVLAYVVPFGVGQGSWLFDENVGRVDGVP